MRVGPSRPQAGVEFELSFARRISATRSTISDRSIGFAAGAMRHILIDHIRAQASDKRGAGRVRVPLSDDLQFVDPGNHDILDLDQALTELAAFDARKAELVQLCAFLGCGRAEAAELLDISLATAKRDFRMARVWLSRRMRLDVVVED